MFTNGGDGGTVSDTIWKRILPVNLCAIKDGLQFGRYSRNFEVCWIEFLQLYFTNLCVTYLIQAYSIEYFSILCLQLKFNKTIPRFLIESFLQKTRKHIFIIGTFN